MPIRSGLFKATPNNVVVLPVLFEGQVKAVIELASVGSFTDLQISFLEQLTAGIGIVLNTIEATMQTEGLLKQSQQLASELQTQQRELQQTNEQLEQKAQQLAEQNVEVERKNQEIEQARRALEEKATELALTSKYKSEFLANMSHELRTPLNSILILGQQLGDNPDGNLTPRQVEFARTIHGAGTDLLNLISDILDLSKIESGTVSVDAEEILLRQPAARRWRGRSATRRRAASCRSTCSSTRRSRAASPPTRKRLQQVLKNLLSNAFKFTEQGGVRLSIARGDGRLDARTIRCSTTRRRWSRSRSPTPASASRRRSSASSSRRSSRPMPAPAASTAAPVSVSRSAASSPNLLGGEIQLRSTPGVGSTFTLYLPLELRRPGARSRPCAASAPARCRRRAARRSRLAERRSSRCPTIATSIEPGDAVLLIVEDDPHYARILVDLAHDQGFKVLVAMRGADALALAREYQPTAISLDVFLPDMLGWTVLSQLKQDPATRHIPVQIVTLDEDRQHGLARGAFSFVTKPTTTEGLRGGARRASRTTRKPRRKRLLVVEDNAGRAAEHHRAARPRRHRHRHRRHRRRGARDAARAAAATASCSICACRTCPASRCSSASATTPTWPTCRSSSSPAASCRPRRTRSCTRMARSVVVKGVESPERLLDETALFLHRVVADLPAEKQRMLERLHSSDEDLVGKHGAAGRRRRAQHLRAQQRARAPRHAGADRDHRQRGDRDARSDARTSRSC